MTNLKEEITSNELFVELVCIKYLQKQLLNLYHLSIYLVNFLHKRQVSRKGRIHCKRFSFHLKKQIFYVFC